MCMCMCVCMCMCLCMWMCVYVYVVCLWHPSSAWSVPEFFVGSKSFVNTSTGLKTVKSIFHTVTRRDGSTYGLVRGYIALSHKKWLTWILRFGNQLRRNCTVTNVFHVYTLCRLSARRIVQQQVKRRDFASSWAVEQRLYIFEFYDHPKGTKCSQNHVCRIFCFRVITVLLC